MRSVPRRGRLSKHPAFTLVEVIASIVIVAVLAVTSASLLGNVTSGYTAAATRAELINDGSAALERLVTSIRDIPLRASVTPARSVTVRRVMLARDSDARTDSQASAERLGGSDTPAH